MKSFGLNIIALHKQKVFKIKDDCDIIITGSFLP